VKSFEDCFHLQFSPVEIDGLADRYPDDDSPALNAGRRIAGGDYRRANLDIIFHWKTKGRGKSRLLHNTDTEIEEALRLAARASTERAAMAVLCGLDGVDVPVASAILTAIDPQRYTVIDFRALESLGTKCSTVTLGFYLAYLKHCRELATQHEVSLRTLDRALWQWSSERKPLGASIKQVEAQSEKRFHERRRLTG
jgi:hypothetical protein